MQNNNRITASGKLEGELAVDHFVAGEPFYMGTLLVKRRSGNVDKIPITIPEKTLECIDGFAITDPITVTGQVRTYNKLVDGDCRLIVTLYAQSIVPAIGCETTNVVDLIGVICKQPTYRETPFGRLISDVMIAVDRGFGKSDYVPIIAWGRNAKWVSKLNVGERICLAGRFQSRDYDKVQRDGSIITRTACEISSFMIRRYDEMKEACGQ